MVYSVIETAKENGLKPYDYLKFLFEQIPNVDMKDEAVREQLLPWSDQLPDQCCMKVKNDTAGQS